MRAGEFRQRVTIETRNETQNALTGAYTETWSTVRSRVDARVKPLSGRELERARQIDPRISHEVGFRYWRNYRTQLTARERLVYHDIVDRRLEIIAAPVDVNEAHREVVVQAAEAK